MFVKWIFCVGGKIVIVSCHCPFFFFFEERRGEEAEVEVEERRIEKGKKKNKIGSVLEDLLHQPPVLVALLDDEADLFLLCV